MHEFSFIIIMITTTFAPAHQAKGAKGRRATGVAEWSFDHQAKVVKV